MLLKSLIQNKSHTVFDVVCENHLAIFYPLPFFELEVINSVLSQSNEALQNVSKYQNISFHWISVNQIS